jgi:hypothetical protein
LEVKLGSFFEELERRAEEDDERAATRAREEEERRRQAELRWAQEQNARIERGRAERLTGEVARWNLARDVRAYVAALRLRVVDAKPENRTGLMKWCDWAEAWADGADPVRNVDSLPGLNDAAANLSALNDS